jgi:mRNA-degrading endonuclease toxin of MazEF toxin-antitoxin module
LTATDPTPHRGEIWTTDLGDPPKTRWVLVVSVDARNISERVDSVLIVPFGSAGVEGPSTLRLDPGETGLPAPSYLKGHFITTVKKSRLTQRLPRALSSKRMRQVTTMMRRAFDPDAPWEPSMPSR